MACLFYVIPHSPPSCPYLLIFWICYVYWTVKQTVLLNLAQQVIYFFIIWKSFVFLGFWDECFPKVRWTMIQKDLNSKFLCIFTVVDLISTISTSRVYILILMIIWVSCFHFQYYMWYLYIRMWISEIHDIQKGSDIYFLRVLDMCVVMSFLCNNYFGLSLCSGSV